MFGFAPKLPVTEDERQWVDEGFHRLETILGRGRMLEAKVVLPAAEDFPDPYDKTPEAAEKLFLRVCAYMNVDRAAIDFEVFPDQAEELREILPSWRGSAAAGPAGLYTHDDPGSEHEDNRNRMAVAIRSTQLSDPLSLVATMAHEVGHVILLGGGLLDPKPADHEPLTDLLTVFLGFGIFNANASARFLKYQDERRHGWSMHRLGYLPEEVYGYALAKFAYEREENNPKWTRHLSTNVRSYFRSSLAWLEKNPTCGA